MAKEKIKKIEFLESTKKYLLKVKKHLEDTETLEKVDDAGLEQLAYYYDTFTRISEIILSEGVVAKNLSGKWESHPLSKELEACQIQLFKIQQEYGLTLRSRSKIKGLEKATDVSPLLEWIEKR